MFEATVALGNLRQPMGRPQSWPGRADLDLPRGVFAYRAVVRSGKTWPLCWFLMLPLYSPSPDSMGGGARELGGGDTAGRWPRATPVLGSGPT